MVWARAEYTYDSAIDEKDKEALKKIESASILMREFLSVLQKPEFDQGAVAAKYTEYVKVAQSAKLHMTSPSKCPPKYSESLCETQMRALEQFAKVANVKATFNCIVIDPATKKLKEEALRLSIFDILEMIADGHTHCGCPYHAEDLLLHLMDMAFLALGTVTTSSSDSEVHKAVMMMVTSAMHDCAKGETLNSFCTKDGVTIVSFPGHCIGGAAIFIRLWTKEMREFFTAREWEAMCATISFHMCGSNKTYTQATRDLLGMLPSDVFVLLLHIGRFDAHAQFRIPSSAKSFETSSDAVPFYDKVGLKEIDDVLVFDPSPAMSRTPLSDYAETVGIPKGQFSVTLYARSAAGKSMAVKIARTQFVRAHMMCNNGCTRKEALTAVNKMVVVVERDVCTNKMALQVIDTCVAIFTKTGQKFPKWLNEALKVRSELTTSQAKDVLKMACGDKQGPFADMSANLLVDTLFKARIDNAIKAGKSVVVDTIAYTFGNNGFRNHLPASMCGMLWMNAPVIPNAPLTKHDANRHGMTHEQQLQASGPMGVLDSLHGGNQTSWRQLRPNADKSKDMWGQYNPTINFPVSGRSFMNGQPDELKNIIFKHVMRLLLAFIEGKEEAIFAYGEDDMDEDGLMFLDGADDADGADETLEAKMLEALVKRANLQSEIALKMKDIQKLKGMLENKGSDKDMESKLEELNAGVESLRAELGALMSKFFPTPPKPSPKK